MSDLFLIYEHMMLHKLLKKDFSKGVFLESTEFFGRTVTVTNTSEWLLMTQWLCNFQFSIPLCNSKYFPLSSAKIHLFRYYREELQTDILCFMYETIFQQVKSALCDDFTVYVSSNLD